MMQIHQAYRSGFSLDLLDVEGGGDKVLMGRLMRGYIDIIGGPNFDRLYHKLKVLLLLLLLLLSAMFFILVR